MNITTEHIDVFPISYSRENKSDARILTEQHIVNIAKIATAAKDASYVISETAIATEKKPFEFMLLGYHVEIINLSTLIGPDGAFESGSIYAKCVFDGTKLANDYTDTEDEELIGTYGGVVFSGTKEDGALEILKRVEDSWVVPATSAYTIDGGEV